MKDITDDIHLDYDFLFLVYHRFIGCFDARPAFDHDCRGKLP